AGARAGGAGGAAAGERGGRTTGRVRSEVSGAVTRSLRSSAAPLRAGSVGTVGAAGARDRGVSAADDVWSGRRAGACRGGVGRRGGGGERDGARDRRRGAWGVARWGDDRRAGVRN